MPSLPPSDPPPDLDMNIPGMSEALAQLKLELLLVQLELPQLTPHQQLQEARRRCARTLVAVADAQEELDRRRRLAQRPPGGAAAPPSYNFSNPALIGPTRDRTSS